MELDISKLTEKEKLELKKELLSKGYDQDLVNYILYGISFNDVLGDL